MKESKGLARSAQRGRREVPCTVILETVEPVLDGEERPRSLKQLHTAEPFIKGPI